MRGRLHLKEPPLDQQLMSGFYAQLLLSEILKMHGWNKGCLKSQLFSIPLY